MLNKHKYKFIVVVAFVGSLLYLGYYFNLAHEVKQKYQKLTTDDHNFDYNNEIMKELQRTLAKKKIESTSIEVIETNDSPSTTTMIPTATTTTTVPTTTTTTTVPTATTATMTPTATTTTMVPTATATTTVLPTTKTTMTPTETTNTVIPTTTTTIMIPTATTTTMIPTTTKTTMVPTATTNTMIPTATTTTMIPTTTTTIMISTATTTTMIPTTTATITIHTATTTTMTPTTKTTIIILTTTTTTMIPTTTTTTMVSTRATTLMIPTTTSPPRDPTTRQMNKTMPLEKDEWLQIKARNPKFWDYGDGTCADNKYRHIFTNILQRWINISTALNIDYMLSVGSLLGAWRNEDVIPWDSDLDILVNSTDLPKMDQIKDSRGFTHWKDPTKVRLIMQEDWKEPKYWTRRRFNCAGKRVRSNSGACGFQEPVARLIGAWGRHMDMYEISMKNGKVYDYSDWKKYFPYDQLYPRKKCKYMGLTLYCPKNPLAILNTFYGRGKWSNLQPKYVCQNQKWVKAKL